MYTHLYMVFTKKDHPKRNDLIKLVIDSQETFIFFFNLLRRIRKELPRIWNNSEICALLKSIRNHLQKVQGNNVSTYR